MNIVAPGLDPMTDQLLVEPLDEDDMATALIGALPTLWPDEQPRAMAAGFGVRLRGKVQRQRTRDMGSPREVGWTYLIGAQEPEREAIATALRPLATHRGMSDAHDPLVFSGEPPLEWQDWMTTNYGSADGDPPHYVLIVGGPERVPFHFQAVLDSAASVGRVAFDDVRQLEAYVEKVLRLEAQDAPGAARKEVVIFATNRGRPDPTYYSRMFMADPISTRVTDKLGVPVTAVVDDRATAGNLLDSLTTRRPALVYTATHGAGRPNAPLEEQLRLGGALVCSGPAVEGAQPLLTANDLPAEDEPVAEGAIVFSFACFSAGTPAESDYHHWFGRVPPVNASSDFVAALPNALLAHPRGPLAFVGHVDLAWLHAFDDPQAPDLKGLYHPRLDVFTHAVDTLLSPQPVGLAMSALNKRYDVGNASLAVSADQAGRGTLNDDPATRRKLVATWILRSDAQNYIVLGDPAVYPQMSDD